MFGAQCPTGVHPSGWSAPQSGPEPEMMERTAAWSFDLHDRCDAPYFWFSPPFIISCPSSNDIKRTVRPPSPSPLDPAPHPPVYITEMQNPPPAVGLACASVCSFKKHKQDITAVVSQINSPKKGQVLLPDWVVLHPKSRFEESRPLNM